MANEFIESLQDFLQPIDNLHSKDNGIDDSIFDKGHPFYSSCAILQDDTEQIDGKSKLYLCFHTKIFFF